MHDDWVKPIRARQLMSSPTAASPLPRACGLGRSAMQPPVPGVPIALRGTRPNLTLSGRPTP